MSDKKKKKAEKKGKDTVRLIMCSRSDCKALSTDVRKAFKKGIKERGLEDQVKLKKDNCIGVCAKQPAVILKRKKKLFVNVSVDDVGGILDKLEK